MKTIRRGGNDFDDHIILALEHLLEIQRMLDVHKYDCFFPAHVARDFRASVHSFLREYTWLGKRADENSLMLFSAVP